MTELISGEGFSCHLPGGQGFPSLIPVKQEPAEESVSDISRAASEAVQSLNTAGNLNPGDRVLVAAGSRGITRLPEILAAVCQSLRNTGVKPAIIGAMGSHGGGTKEGQRQVLAALGVTEETVGARVITSDEAVVIGKDCHGRCVYCDPLVFSYDGFLAVNRVKPHTSAAGEIQSGIIKMLVVGMGHRPGAEAFHMSAPGRLSQTLINMWSVIREKTPFLGGIALVENARKQPAAIEGIRPANLLQREKKLLTMAEELMPTLPFDSADVLVVREMGKNYSGTGMDTNVIGRRRVQGISPGTPQIDKIAVLDLTEASHGNACGVGLADFMTARLARKIDLQATYLNVLTSRLTTGAMLPMIMSSDRDAAAAAVVTCGTAQLNDLRLAVISDTLHLDDLWVTRALWDDMRRRNGISRAAGQLEMAFDDNGRLLTGQEASFCE